MKGLLAWRDAARAKGLSGLVVLDGSFVSAKPAPGDFDLIFLFDEASKRVSSADEDAKALLDNASCVNRFGGDVWAFSAGMALSHPHFVPLDTFDRTKDTRKPKGVLEVTI